jgi:hypothetical protein
MEVTLVEAGVTLDAAGAALATVVAGVVVVRVAPAEAAP